MIPIKYTVQNLIERKWRTLITGVGIAFAIAVFAAMSAVTQTMIRTFRSTGLSDEVVILKGGSLNVDFSNIERESLAFIQTLDGVVRLQNTPLVSPELYLGTVVRAADRENNVSVRGVTAVAPKVYRQVTLAKGRWPAPGRNAAVGKALANKLGLNIGDKLMMQNETWTITGIISSEGRVYDQEIWTDLDELAAVANRKTYSNYTVRTTNAETAATLINTINENRRYPLLAMTGPVFYQRSGSMSILMAGIGTFISIVIAIGSVFGVMNTMYSFVASRRREIGILKAIGYRSRAILAAFAFESVVLGIGGGLLGLVIASGLSLLTVDLPYLPAGNVNIGAMQVISAVLLSGIVGFFGGILPSLQAARMKVVDLLQ